MSTPERRTTLVCAFDDRNEAELAVDELESLGFKHDEIGFVIRGSDAVQGGMITDTVGAKDGPGAATGAITGGMVGGILAAAVALILPGVGPVLAGGVLASFFGGAIAGTAIGGILGAMRGLEVSEDEAKFFEAKFHEGKAIVAVKPGNRALEAAEILRRHGGYDLHTQQGSPIPTGGTFAHP